MDLELFLGGEWSDADLVAAARARGVDLAPAALAGLRVHLTLLRESSLTLLAVQSATGDAR